MFALMNSASLRYLTDRVPSRSQLALSFVEVSEHKPEVKMLEGQENGFTSFHCTFQ